MPPSLSQLNQEHPWNQAARGQLQKLGVRPDPSSLFLLQLPQWYLQEYPDNFPRQQRESLQAQLEVLQGAEPQQALQFFQSPDSQEESLLSQALLEHPDPEEAVHEVLGALWDKLQTMQAHQ